MMVVEGTGNRSFYSKAEKSKEKSVPSPLNSVGRNHRPDPDVPPVSKRKRKIRAV